MDLPNLTNATLLVCYACNGTNPASSNATVIVPTRNTTPKISIGMETELLTAVGTMLKHQIENGWIAVPAAGLNLSSFYGVELAVREKYNAKHFANLLVLVNVPQKVTKPNLTIDRNKQTVKATTDIEYSHRRR